MFQPPTSLAPSRDIDDALQRGRDYAQESAAFGRGHLELYGPMSEAGNSGTDKAAAYRVLARKYRPSNFSELVGQEPMVRTLANSFSASRIHQAYILTGVRGVGKTTTARILARAFNYSLRGKIDRPSVDMPELGEHCQAIMESRHVDVIEPFDPRREFDRWS